MENNINLTPDAVKAIQALQHPCGTYQFYRTHLDRLFNYILNDSDEIGMSDNEAMHTLRALNALRSDIADIAGPPAPLNGSIATVESITILDDTDEDEPFALNEPREMLHDVEVARFKINEAVQIISEAIQHASNSGERFETVINDLNDIAGDLEAPMAALDAIMAIDPDTYEPKEITNREAAAIFLNRAYNAAGYAYELAADALDRAQRSDEIVEEQIEMIKAAHAEAKQAAQKFGVMAKLLDGRNETE